MNCKIVMMIASLALMMTASAPSGAQTPHGQDVFERLADFRPGDGRQELQRLLQSLRDAMSADPYRSWMELKPVMESQDVPWAIKWAGFPVVLEAADAQTARAVVIAATEWTRLDRSDESVAREHNDPAWLTLKLLETLTASRQWQSWTADESLIGPLLINVAIGGAQSREAVAQAVEALSVVLLEVAPKSRIAEEIIRRRPNGGVHSGFYAFLNIDSIARLREVMRQSVQSRGKIHFGAAAALAHVGDQASLPTLEAYAEAIDDTSPQLAVSIRIWIERIQIQNPPSRLLGWIADPARADIRTGGYLPWAIERAVAHGLDNEEIRLAVLQYAANARGTDAEMTLFDVKQAAFDMGVLREDDLPEVKQPPHRIEH